MDLESMRRALKEAPVPIEIRQAFVGQKEELDPRIEAFLTEYQAWYSGMRKRSLGPERRPQIAGFMTTNEWSCKLPDRVKEIQERPKPGLKEDSSEYFCRGCNSPLPNALQGDFSCPRCH